MIMSEKVKVKDYNNMCECNDAVYYECDDHKVNGEGLIRGEIILNAWHNYCMESKLFRIMRMLKLRN